MKLGLLINFGAPLIKDGIFRVVNGLEDEAVQSALTFVPERLCVFAEKAVVVAVPLLCRSFAVLCVSEQMKLTYNWLRDYCACDLPVEELARKLSMSGTLIEEIHNLGDDALLAAEITSNRPDLLGILGIAREVSALTGAPLRLPEADFPCGEEKVASATSVEVLAPALCPRYTARLIRGVKIGPSPDWLRQPPRSHRRALHQQRGGRDELRHVRVRPAAPRLRLRQAPRRAHRRPASRGRRDDRLD